MGEGKGILQFKKYFNLVQEEEEGHTTILIKK